MQKGLVVEGGGMRGIYAAGVLDVLMEHQVKVDGVIGVSAGAIHGCSYVSGQIGRSIRYYRKYCKDKRFMSIYSWLTTRNIVGTEFCYHDLPEKLDVFDYDTYEKSNVKFYATCSNVETGQPEYLQIKDMRKEIDLMRASASLPFFSEIVEFNGKKYLDGGCTDSIPVRAFQKMGYKKCIVILTRDINYRKKPANTKLAKLVYRKYPKFCSAMAMRHINYNHCLMDIQRQEKTGDVFVIRPSEELKIGRMSHDIDEIQHTYDIGRKDAEAAIARLKQWLADCEK